MRRSIVAGSRLNASRVLEHNAHNGLRIGASVSARLGGYGRLASARQMPLATARLQTRAFSAAAPRQLADVKDAVEEAFDPSTIERESDEVDVCIVGGGMYFPVPTQILDFQCTNDGTRMVANSPQAQQVSPPQSASSN